MSRAAKAGVVCAGYLAAIGAAVAAAWFYDWRMSLQPFDTSGGMYAGGELMTALTAFFIVALAPTLLLLWFLRRHEGFWNLAGILSLTFAAIGLIAVLSPLVIDYKNEHGALVLLSLVAVFQWVGVPLWATACLFFAFLAPTQRTRRQMVAALGIELVIGVCTLIHWFVPNHPL